MKNIFLAFSATALVIFSTASFAGETYICPTPEQVRTHLVSSTNYVNSCANWIEVYPLKSTRLHADMVCFSDTDPNYPNLKIDKFPYAFIGAQIPSPTPGRAARYFVYDCFYEPTIETGQGNLRISLHSQRSLNFYEPVNPDNWFTDQMVMRCMSDNPTDCQFQTIDRP